jgi:hypothetical protein
VALDAPDGMPLVRGRHCCGMLEAARNGGKHGQHTQLCS